MSTTIRRFVATLFTVLLVWFAGLAIVAVTLEPTADVIVFAPPGTIGAVFSRASVAIVDVPGGFLRARGIEPGFVRALYAGGAWLVLPATFGGCRGGYRADGRIVTADPR